MYIPEIVLFEDLVQDSIILIYWTLAAAHKLFFLSGFSLQLLYFVPIFSVSDDKSNHKINKRYFVEINNNNNNICYK